MALSMPTAASERLTGIPFVAPQQQAHGKLTAPDRQEPVQEDGHLVDGDRPGDADPAGLSRHRQRIARTT